MFNKNEAYSQDEQIDYIYKTLKKQEARYMRQSLFKWIWRGLYIYAVFQLYILATKGAAGDWQNKISPELTKIVTPIVQNVTNDILKQTQADLTKQYQDQLNQSK